MMKITRFFTFPLFGIFFYLLPTPSSYTQTLDTEDWGAIVEYDSIEILTIGKKASLIQITFKRKYEVRLITEEGVGHYSHISLPESYDPILKIHAPEARNLGKHLTNIKLEVFKASITKPDGSVQTPAVNEKLRTFKSVEISEDKYGECQAYDFDISGLQAGDLLSLEYAYTVMYSENLFSLMTFRIFFHGDYPVLKKDITLVKERVLDAEINTFFCDDSYVEEGSKIIYAWHFEDLEGCMKESGIRPYKTLPHIIISLMPDIMTYTPPTSFEVKYIPFYVFGPAIRESRHLTIVKAMLNGVNSKQYNQIRDYIDARLENTADDNTGYTQLYSVQNYIAENFEFDPDLEYFDRLDTRDERMGDYITEGKIRDRSRYNVYVALIAGLELNYFTAYLADKRSGIISDYYFEPTISNDNLFAVLLRNEAVQFIYPKKDRFGYFLNELPFYFEDTRVRLLYLDDFRDYKKAIEEKFVSTMTPPSSSQDNTRKQSASVNIDLDEMTVDFNASISLGGQFSTLGRGAYLYNTCDNTVNPNYCQKFWEGISPEIVPETFEIGSIDQDFPFRASFSTSFQARDIMIKVNDTITLDLSGWFNHIVDENLNADWRVLTYYPDFKYTDSYNYHLVFNKKVKVLNRMPILEIKNAYGMLSLKCIQKMDGTVLLSSRVVVLAEKVSPDKIDMVSEIQEELRKLNQVKMRIIELE